MDLKSTYTVFKFFLKWKEIFISLKFDNIRNNQKSGKKLGKDDSILFKKLLKSY
jgi:hypothetical protein